MNRLAIVLAADSATTVSKTTSEGNEERYFKGANKIFQLSHHNPVGIMIYDSADILGVPWEIVIKSFRDQLGRKSFNSLEGYADEFFAYMNSNTRLFPEDIQKKQFIKAAHMAALHILTPEDPNNDEIANRKSLDERIRMHKIEVDNWEFQSNIDQGVIQIIYQKWRDELVDNIKNSCDFLKIQNATDPIALANLAISIIAKRPQLFMGATGLVFAGFGDHDIFPAMTEFKSYGIVDGNHISEKGQGTAINHEVHGWLSAFAQTSMSDTFSLGLSIDTYSSMMNAVSHIVEELAENIKTACGAPAIDDVALSAMLSEARNKVSERVLNEASSDHAIPMRQVIAVLPVDEMAELAETLINLQSLKEKVTKPSETVGGPIDVAVITKSEGLVWIKRKLFFDASVNSRYTQRQSALYK